jgi:hypothetical protein
MGVVTVGNPEDLVAAVRHLELKGMDALALIGWITAQSAGGGIRPASRTTEAKLRRLAREAGVGLSRVSTVARRLDFASGQEIVDAVGALARVSAMETVVETNEALTGVKQRKREAPKDRPLSLKL